MAPTIWQRLRKRKLAVFGMALIFLTLYGALFAPYLTPFEPNDQMFDGLKMQGAIVCELV